jgi:predicted small metal-binding protein
VTIKLNCHDLGIKNCDWVASGDTPADVVKEAVAHLRHEHGLDMPDAELIMEGKDDDDPIFTTASEAVQLVVKRLDEKLHLDLAPTREPAVRFNPATIEVTQ